MAGTLSLSRIGFGSAALANGPDWDWTTSISEAQAVDCVQVAYTRGIRFFDTAPSYGMGEAERRLGIALKGLPRETFIIATKVGYTRDSACIHYDYSREGVLRSLDDSLKRLHLDYVDILHIHDPDHHIQQVLNETFPVLAKLREQGVIGKISAGMNQWQVPLEMVRAADFDMLMIAGRYTLLEQGALPLLDYCAAHKIEILAAAIYNSGILATGVHHPHARYNHAPVPAEIRARTAAIQTVCSAFGVSLHTAATQFPLAHAAVKSAVVGFQTTQEIEQCLNALQVSIPAAFWERLRQEGLLEKKVPIPTDKVVSS
jgi:D-threo-aldose 1-dehydrogenase